jgi:hypothetical protein
MAGVPEKRLRCYTCPDSCVTDVATQDRARPEGFEHTLSAAMRKSPLVAM